MARPRDIAAVAYTPLTEPENAHGPTAEEPAAVRQKRSVWARLGISRILILSVGSIILALFILPLAWLWAESMAAMAGQRPSSAWISVIEENWITRVVTISTAILRAVVTAQASVATVMFAAIILERIGTPLIDVPFYSTARALNGSPTNLLWSKSMPLHKNGLSILVVSLILVEVAVTLAAQFLSTLLVSDFGNGTYSKASNTTNVRILSPKSKTMAQSWWSMPPPMSWTFAEESEPYSTGINYDDTSHTYRAFLPFLEKDQRTSLRSFRGPVPIMDQRVVCVQPALRDLRLDVLNGGSPRLSGQIAIANDTYPMLQQTETQSYIPFMCALPTVFTLEPQGATSLCWVNSGYDWDVLVQDALVRVGPITSNGSLIVGYPQASTMFMLLDVVSRAALWTGMVQNVSVAGGKETESSPWVIVGDGSNNPAVRVTSCMANLGIDTFTADIHSEWETSEPEMSWNQPKNSYNTSATRSQLGAVRPQQSLHDRGVLGLSPRSKWRPIFPDVKIAHFDGENASDAEASNALDRAITIWTFPMAFANSLSAPQSRIVMPVHRNQTLDPGLILSRYTSIDPSNAHEMYRNLFQDTLNQTNSPALALQAVLMRVCQMIYYEDLLRLNETQAAETAFSHAAVIPTRWMGFGVGMGLLGTHLVVMGIVLGLFLRYTRHSLLGNYWQAVSQIYSEETSAVLEQADQMDDDEVECWIKRKIPAAGLFGVALDSDGRVALRVKQLDGHTD